MAVYPYNVAKSEITKLIGVDTRARLASSLLKFRPCKGSPGRIASSFVAAMVAGF